MKGLIKEDKVYNIVEGYSVNGIPICLADETLAKNNVGKEVIYEINHDGYKPCGMFKESFYQKAKIIKINE